MAPACFVILLRGTRRDASAIVLAGVETAFRVAIVGISRLNRSPDDS